jgi:hypothetical protein
MTLFDELADIREVTVVLPAPGRKPVRVPIWVVAVDGELYVRSWKGGDGIWYRRARQSGTGAVVVGGEERPTRFVPVGGAELDAAIDREFLSKYGDSRHSRAMIEPPAAGTTLRLDAVE